MDQTHKRGAQAAAPLRHNDLIYPAIYLANVLKYIVIKVSVHLPFCVSGPENDDFVQLLLVTEIFDIRSDL